MDATNVGWTSVRPESDEERFGMRSQERQAAFDKIEAERSSVEIDRVLWAFCQFADLDFVKRLAASDAVWNAETDFPRTNAAIDAVRLWQQKPEVKNDVASSNAVAPVSRPHTASGKASRTRSGRSEDGQEASLGRSAVVAARCKDRDGNFCAVSRTKGAEAVSKLPVRTAYETTTDFVNRSLGPHLSMERV
ncbi:uncharacterized protein J4E88_000026 [Alternaria novae-zelandiae]|uniref:uncharacterized protein n=1 Tax=Alternaria novae-zelandiae TaxID=430562 RepID=UPI0020C43667|nr:uncharacterized protein J4E88_000026 [Alternaria novae-zelandiae]KAI4695856.1 hypothetical protein J4E88_000026 [Alternaria novae-zelandiae]